MELRDMDSPSAHEILQGRESPLLTSPQFLFVSFFLFVVRTAIAVDGKG